MSVNTRALRNFILGKETLEHFVKQWSSFNYAQFMVFA